MVKVRNTFYPMLLWEGGGDGGVALGANFTLRNVIDGQGEEYMNISPHAAMGE